MTKLAAELIGTMLLVTLGDGVVANVVLNKSKGQNSGWIVVATGWGMAVALAVYSVGWISGGHPNPRLARWVGAPRPFSLCEESGFSLAPNISPPSAPPGELPCG